MLIAQDPKGTYLGAIENEYESDSIFNEYGDHGSEYSADSIWNQYGNFGGEYSNYSPFNSYSNEPPMIIKGGNIVGYLTVNEYVEGSLSPYVLRGMCHREL